MAFNTSGNGQLTYSVAKKKTTLRGSSHGAAGCRPSRRDFPPGVPATGVWTSRRPLMSSAAATWTKSGDSGGLLPVPAHEQSVKGVTPRLILTRTDLTTFCCVASARHNYTRKESINRWKQRKKRRRVCVYIAVAVAIAIAALASRVYPLTGVRGGAAAVSGPSPASEERALTSRAMNPPLPAPAPALASRTKNTSKTANQESRETYRLVGGGVAHVAYCF
uniref:Uncharacterized protein n=1 Tax=Oryza punctata TaxID=4537 RepID=A0A0E0LLK7_ORYPU